MQNQYILGGFTEEQIAEHIERMTIAIEQVGIEPTVATHSLILAMTQAFAAEMMSDFEGEDKAQQEARMIHINNAVTKVLSSAETSIIEDMVVLGGIIVKALGYVLLHRSELRAEAEVATATE